MDVLCEDARLHDTLFRLTETVAKASLDYGSAYRLGGLRSIGEDLTKKLQHIRASNVPTRKTKRWGLRNGLRSRDDTEGQLLDRILDGAGSGNGSLGDLFGQALSGLGGDLAGALATPAYFLGIGLGMGAEKALNLTYTTNVTTNASSTVSATGEEPTGLNLVAQNLGSGLSAKLTPALRDAVPLGKAAYALAQGLGQGSANGFGLTQEKFEPSNNSDYMSIARNVGLGLSGSIASNSKPRQLFIQSVFGDGDVAAQLPKLAMAAGQGLGEGASKGLGLTRATDATTRPSRKRQTPNNSTLTDIPGAIESLTFGLSESFLQSANLSKIFDPSSLNIDLDAAALRSYASGAGKGIGEGLALGLNLTTGSEDSVTSPTRSIQGLNATKEQIAEQVVGGLVAGFLRNGGAAAAGKALNSSASGLMRNIDSARVAEGVARGFIEGVVHGLSEAGGLRHVLSGNFSQDLPSNLPSLPPTAFNDSLDGSAVAFMRGLSGEGLLLAAQYMNKGRNGSAAPSSGRNAEVKRVGKRTASLTLCCTNVVSVVHNRHSRHGHLKVRATAPDIVPAADKATLSGIAQSGVSTLTCAGVGGIAAVAMGIMDGSKLVMNTKGNTDSIPLDNSTLAALPKEPFTVTSDGNTFLINITERTFKINGLAFKPFAVITGLHVLLTTLAFFFILPIYLVMGAVMRISIMINIPYNEARNKKWRTILLLYVFTPLALGGTILGFVAMGNSKHLRSAHGVLGLIALIIAIPTVIVSFFRLRTPTPQPAPCAFASLRQLPALLKGPQKVHVYSGILVQLTLGLSMVCWIEGWNDLRSISLCVVDAVLSSSIMVKLTNLLVFLQIGAMAIFGLRHYLEVRIAKMEATKAKGGDIITDYVNEKIAACKAQAKAHKRTDTIKTWGFDAAPPSLPSENVRRTAELLGREDSQIGWPSEVRRFGEEDPASPRAPAQNGLPHSTLFPSDARTYNPKLGGFEDDRSPRFPPPPEQPVGLASQPPSAYGDYRSSSIYEQSRVASYAVVVQPQRLDGRGISKNTGGNEVKKVTASRPFNRREADEAEEWFGKGEGEEKWLKEFGPFRRW